jgi:hypothetical protein
MSYQFLQDSDNYNYTNSADSNKERFPFNYTDSKAVTVLSKALTSVGIEKWKQCAEEAMRCCENMKASIVRPGMEFETYFRT